MNISGGKPTTAPVVTVKSGSITLSNTSVAERTVKDTLIGVLSVDLPGQWLFEIISTYNADGCAAQHATDTTKLITTAIPFLYAVNSSPSIRVKATRYLPYCVLTQDIVLTVTQAPVAPWPTPTVDYDFIGKNYSGATLAEIGLVVGDLDVDGYFAPGTGYEVISPNSMNPSGSGWTSNGASINTIEATDARGFTPVLINASQSGKWRQTTTRSLQVGELVTIKIKATTPDGYVHGFNVAFGGAYTLSLPGADADMRNISWRMPGYNFTSGIIVGSSYDPADQTQTWSYRFLATANAPLSIDFWPKENNSRIKILGCMVYTGRRDRGWVANGATAYTIPSKNLPLSGIPAAIMAGSAWTVAFECHQIQSKWPCALLSDDLGAILRVTGATSAAVGRSGALTEGKVGTGGFLGITRVAIAGDANGVKISINDGVVATTSTTLSFSGTLKLLTDTMTKFRRLSFWNYKVTDDQLRQISSLANRSLSYLDDAVVPQNTTEVFMDDFLTDSIRRRAGDGRSLPYYNFAARVDAYKDDPRVWIPRAVHWDQPIGSHANGINNELQLLIDPQYFEGYPDNGGWTGPFSWDVPSCLRLTIARTDSLPAATQALIPNQKLTPSANTEAYKWQWVSGHISAPTRASVGVNSFWTARVKMADAQGLWPAVWGIGIDPNVNSVWRWGQYTELDLIEIFGSSTGQYAGSVHTNSYAIRRTYRTGNGLLPFVGCYLPDEFHTFEAKWMNGYVEWSLSGMRVGQLTTTDTNLDDYEQFPMISLSIWGSGNTFTQNSASILVDHYRILKMAIPPATLPPVTLSAYSGLASAFSATVQSGVLAKFSLVDNADGRFSLSGTTLTAVATTPPGVYVVTIMSNRVGATNDGLTTDLTIELL